MAKYLFFYIFIMVYKTKKEICNVGSILFNYLYMFYLACFCIINWMASISISYYSNDRVIHDGMFSIWKDALQTKIHCAVVQVSIWSTLAWCLLHSPWWLTPAAMVLPFIPYFVNKITKKIPKGLLVEYSAFLSVFLYLAVYSIVALF